MDLSTQGFADASYADKAFDHRSVSGGVMMCCMKVIAWFSRTLKCVTHSSPEAGCVALGDLVKELFLRGVAVILAGCQDAVDPSV